MLPPRKSHHIKYHKNICTCTQPYKIVIAFILRLQDEILVGCCYSALRHFKGTKMKMKMKNTRLLTEDTNTDESEENDGEPKAEEQETSTAAQRRYRPK